MLNGLLFLLLQWMPQRRRSLHIFKYSVIANIQSYEIAKLTYAGFSSLITLMLVVYPPRDLWGRHIGMAWGWTVCGVKGVWRCP